MKYPSFTLVSTVFNEIDRLRYSISDIENQSLLPNEIVITDAGSTDGTVDLLKDWAKRSSINIMIIELKGCNVAQGRNKSIQSASFDIIVSTDFGCRYEQGWLKSLVEPFMDERIVVVGGAYTVNEKEIATLAAKANYLLTKGYEIVMDEHFIPSSRSIAYYKSAWKATGGYPEWLTLAADDLVFGMLLRAKGYHFHLVKRALVKWGRHLTVRGYARESYRYGLGDGEARVNFRNFVSNLMEVTCRFLLFSGAILFFLNLIFDRADPIWLIAFTPGLVGLRSYKNAWKNWVHIKSKKYHFGVFLFSLLLIEKTRVNYLKGYVKGFYFSSRFVKENALRLSQDLK